MSFKRPRTPTRSSCSSSSSPSPTLEPTPKSSRTTTSSSSRPLLCTLPPTCNPPRNQPTHIANTRDLEIHYATYHAHVCEFQGCGSVFPDARLLELHQTECHDPLAALRKERGEKIFACHLTSCARLFSNPKTRRLHLIDTHSYPKEYFFAVTNKGVGGLLKKWGDGASMLRKEWKDRDGDDAMEADEGILAERVANENSHHDTTVHTKPQPPPKPRTKAQTTENADDQMDGLTSSMTSLSLVPPSIRFGRGGKSGGFGNGNLNGQAETPTPTATQSGINTQPAGNAGVNIAGGRGRPGGRGRARGGFVHPPANGNHIIRAPGAVPRGGFAVLGVPAGRAGIINFVPGRGRGRGGPRGRGRGGFGPIPI